MQKFWEDYYNSSNYYDLEPHPYLDAFLLECKKKKIDNLLDLGCGVGADMLYAAERGFKVVGVDFSPAAASNAEDLLNTKGYDSKVYIDNIFDSVTTFNEAEFGAIMAINSLQYTDADGFEQALAEINRMLIPGGIMLLVVSSVNSKIDNSKPEQIYFTDNQLMDLLMKRYGIIEFMKDDHESFVVIVEKRLK